MDNGIKKDNTYQILFLILFIAFILRFTNIFYGLPQPGYFSSDEIDVISRTLRLASGDFAPAHFNKPTLYNLILLFFYGIYYIILKIFGVNDLKEYFQQVFIQNPTIFYFSARFVNVLLSTASIFLTYLIGKKIKNNTTGLTASLITALCFTTVKMAHIAKEDILMTFLILSVILFCCDFFSTKRNYFLYLSSLFVGLSISAKYTGILSLIFPLFCITIIFKDNKNIKFLSINLLKVIFFMIIGFGIGMPYFIFHPLKFLNGIIESKIFEQVKWQTTWLGGEEHFGISFIIQMFIKEYGMVLVFFIIAAIMFFIIIQFKFYFKQQSQVYNFHLFICNSLIIFILTNLIIFLISGHLDYHYILPITPCISVLTGLFLNLILNRKNNKYLVLIIIILVFEPFIYILKFDLETLGKDTRIIAANYIEKNISENNKIVCDTAYFYQYHPPISPDDSSIDVLINQAEETGGSGNYYKLLKKYKKDKPSYNITFLSMPTWGDKLTSESLNQYSISYLKAIDADYIICSSFYYNRILMDKNTIWKPIKKFYEELPKQTLMIQKISPKSFINSGPELFIYKMKGF